MEKSKSFPYHSASYKEARFDFEDRTKSFSFNGPVGGNSETKRRKRIASYNMYSVEEFNLLEMDMSMSPLPH
ncbi:hypothetical protein H5410_023157 [Solanum commersonii]|uniref:BEACH domain-containing protein n=1 Tax=Solanum commersonii TaxID=4109 RepID=A0A9J5ZJ73_SOLCO|nr:hypothetical protein H5410_023157 [Solanum commersonii]